MVAEMDENTIGPLLVKVPDSLCQTEMQEISFSFLWTIFNLSLIICQGCSLKSRTFDARETDQTRFRLELHHKDFRNDIRHMRVLLYMESTNLQFYAPITSKISIINSRGEVVETWVKKSKSERENPFHKDEFYINNNTLWVGNPPMAKLSVYCEITMVDELVTETRDLQKKDNIQLLQDHAVFSNFESLLESPELSDVTLVAEGKEFFAHKVILAGGSPVFAAMFTQKMEQNAQNMVNISDLSQEVVSEMLRFVYTGRAFKIETMAAGLLFAADKYALKGLERVCEEALSRNITVETASEILVLADMH